MLELCAVSTWFMTGLVWFVQVVHYPLFRAVGVEQFVAYHALHGRRTALVVAPVMTCELVTAGGLAIDGTRGGLAVAGLALAAATWVFTFLFAVPMHDRLAAGLDPAAVGRLVRTGWLRTAAWTGHGVVVIAMLHA